jgi:hypothetical protein
MSNLDEEPKPKLKPSNLIKELIRSRFSSSSGSGSDLSSSVSSCSSKLSSHRSILSTPRSRLSSDNSSLSSSSSRSRSNSSDLVDECEKFIDVLTNVFERPDNIDASIYCSTPEDIQDDCSDPFVYINIWNKHTQHICAYVQYCPSVKVITIEEIARCSGDILPEQGSGTDIVTKLISVAEAFKRELEPGTNLLLIIESDQSKLTIKGIPFDLARLYLLATGQTWYNSLGFREEAYDGNTEFMNEFIDKIDKKDGSTTIREKFQKIKRDLRDPDISIDTVQRYKQELDGMISQLDKSLAEATRNGRLMPGQFQNKFSDIKYDLETRGGNKRRRVKGKIKSKRRTKKRKGKKNKRKTKRL